MLVGSNSNPYKKLLETTEVDERNELLYKSLISHLNHIIKSAIEHVMEFDYIEEYYKDDLKLYTFGYSENNLKKVSLLFIDAYIIHNDIPIFSDTDVKSIHLIDEFIRENITNEFEEEEKPLDKYVKLIDKNFMDIRDYLILGRFTGLPNQEELELFNDDTIKLLNGESKELFTVIRELPYDYLIKIEEELYDSIPNFLIVTDQIKDDPNIKQVTLELVDLIDYDIFYPVGIEKEIFLKYYIDFLRKNGLLGIKSEDNTVWEEEE